MSNESNDVEFGDPELTRRSESEWVPIPPEQQGVDMVCEHVALLDSYLLPSGKVVYFWSNRYNLAFEIVYGSDTPVPDKLVRIKGKGSGSCGRLAKYSDGETVKCGPCGGLEPMPPGTPTLTIEGLEAAGIQTGDTTR